VTEWTSNYIKATIPEGVSAGDVAVVDRTGISEAVPFKIRAKTGRSPIERVSGIGDKYSRMLREAGIDTDTKLLSLPVEKTASILGITKTKALSLFELTARGIYDKRTRGI